MRTDDSAIVSAPAPLSPARTRSIGSPGSLPGLWWGLLGVLAFSFTLPMTRIAVGGMSPLFVGAGRAVLAAALAATALAWTRQRPPSAPQWARLAVTGAGVVVGFPMLTSVALQHVTSAHAAVIIAVLPAATAVATVLRTGERPAALFWSAALAGAVAVGATAGLQGGSGFAFAWADLWLVAAVISAAVGYAEGGMLARELGAWQTISWALVLFAPVMLTLTVVSARLDPPHASAGQWAAFGYLGAVSMFAGFVAWYRGLALGPMAQVSQVQLTQPVMTLLWATLLLHEHPAPITVLGGIIVILCTAGAVRSRAPKPHPA